MHTINPSNLNRVSDFLKVAVDAGLIPPDDYDTIISFLHEKQNLSTSSQQREIHLSRLLSLSEAANRLSCSKRTISRMLRDGRLTPVYLNPHAQKCLRVKANEIKAICGTVYEKGDMA